MLMALSKLLYRDHESNRTKLRDWAVREARAGYYSQAALSSNDSKTRCLRCMKPFIPCHLLLIPLQLQGDGSRVHEAPGSHGTDYWRRGKKELQGPAEMFLISLIRKVPYGLRIGCLGQWAEEKRG